MPTTLHSFPPAPNIGQARAAFRRGELSALDHLCQVRGEIERVRRQETLGLDLLVHGEAERGDPIGYFSEHLWGFAGSEHGWVQSHGSGCVKPPILYGDVYRPEPMTVETLRYAQSLTGRPVKGLLTGPATLLQGSFVRDDQPREATALQLALAIRDEVIDLENAGIGVIQIDEPAFRTALPPRRGDGDPHLPWVVNAFRISAGGVADRTQVHARLGHAGLDECLPAIAALDADVVLFEAVPAAMGWLGDSGCASDVGVGLHDLPVLQRALRSSSPEHAGEAIPPERLWIHSGSGLATCDQAETELALAHMVEVARSLRQVLAPHREQEHAAAD